LEAVLEDDEVGGWVRFSTFQPSPATCSVTHARG
jgi:hypothetical protein